jgi:hypothetical protein
MKINSNRKLKNLLKLVIISLVFAVSSYAQIPQYYNFNNILGSNSIPFGSSTNPGMRVQWLIGPTEFNQPSPAPTGYIEKLWFKVGSSNFGSGTYSDLTIKLGQTNLTSLPDTSFYSGQMNTVYFRSSVTVTAPANTFTAFVLDTSFAYNPDLSLVIEVVQCGVTNGGFSLCNTAMTGHRRSYGIGSCPQGYFHNPAPLVPNCGIDITPLSGITIINNQIPETFSLKQNYPNPFNPSTIIKYQLPTNNYVTLKIYDMTGKEVATLVNEQLQPGTYEVNFDGSNIPSGVYFYKLKAGEFSQIRKMILIK